MTKILHSEDLNIQMILNLKPVFLLIIPEVIFPPPNTIKISSFRKEREKEMWIHQRFWLQRPLVRSHSWVLPLIWMFFLPQMRPPTLLPLTSSFHLCSIQSCHWLAGSAGGWHKMVFCPKFSSSPSHSLLSEIMNMRNEPIFPLFTYV